ncbi:LysE family transporter [Cupriavidus sp. 2SB]|uniref:LysE family translocator n=1 Tax=Cupriavidus sp. 2SB TaxID=2502199 RepID=UPI002016ED94|nr:LysE family transporter [Cupriavidus sp. 2SB]
MLAGIGATLAVGAASPGPTFLMVARTAVSRSRRESLTLVTGIGLGSVLLATLAVCGLHTLLVAAPKAYFVLRVIGGIYLLAVGFSMWRGSMSDNAMQAASLTPEQTTTSARRILIGGLAMQISNPKTLVVYASVFATFLPQHVSILGAVAIPVVVFGVEAGWYATVAMLLATERPRRAYLRLRKWIDRTAGTLMAALGIKLLASA